MNTEILDMALQSNNNDNKKGKTSKKLILMKLLKHQNQNKLILMKL